MSKTAPAYSLFVRADAGADIGIGHVMRCLALAYGWQDRNNGSVTFVGRIESDDLKARISAAGFEYIPVTRTYPDEQDRQIMSEIIQKQEDPAKVWCVLDGYHFDIAYHRAVKDIGCKLLVVDDYAHLAEYEADIILNQNIYATSLDYCCSSHTSLLRGSRYVLLRRQFRESRQPEKEIPDKAGNVLLTFGGSDPQNVTIQVIKALKQARVNGVSVKIILGPADNQHSALESELQEAGFTSEILTQVFGMASLMDWADLAITAGGTTCWELAFMGVPAAVIIVADNQERVAAGIAAAEAGLNLGWYHDLSDEALAAKINRFMEDKRLRRTFSQNGQRLVDGRGALRVVERMLPGRLFLRPALDDDCELVYGWANDPVTRRNSFQSDYITWEEHRKWFRGKMKAATCSMYIAQNEQNEKVGLLRFEVQDKVATISVSVAAQFRGFGYGSRMIRSGCEDFWAANRVERLDAIIKNNNEPSRRVFAAVGFKDNANIPCWEKNAFVMSREAG